ncbi:hypothetical protein ABJI51_03265 [Amycolatopsis sp. NEAU-NG30]|uniref:Uncharacterized protein n=1 Tax=Amycolatopsis melonis TaxID=3156488 RepID=A0ABV0L6Z4_9PSEU
MNSVETAANALTADGLPVPAGGFTERELPVSCTPAAIDLAGVGLAAAGLGYMAMKGFYHQHRGGHFTDGPDGVRFPEGRAASADELIRYRAG